MIKLDLTDDLAMLTLSPDDVDAATLSVDYLVGYLSDSGVCCGILTNALADVVRQVGKDRAAIEGLVIAKQIEPRDGQPAPIIQCLGNDQIAAPGDTIIELGDPVAAIDGKTIRGELIKASATPEAVLLTGGANTELVDGTRLIATVYGKVQYSDKVYSVVPPIVVENEQMTAAIDVHPISSAGVPITHEMVVESLAAAGVLHGIDERKIEATIQQAIESDSPLLQQVVAVGTAAVRGIDARIEHFVETDQEIGEHREDGSIDFQKRSTIRNVKSGVRICRLIPAIDGQPKTDVYGESSHVESGQDIDFEAGENVELRGDDFWSMIDGAMVVKKNIVSVFDIYSFDGDVDIQSGNLQHQKGSIHIQGTVRSGFEVQAGSHIIVDETVEDAILKCGGDVEVMGGVIHAGDGNIEASGNVTTKYAQNAKIYAGGDIVINGPAMNCNLYAGSRIIITGAKARLIGGKARASGGFQIRQLGSETCAPTLVTIDVDRNAIEALKLEIEEMQKAIDAGNATEADMERLTKTLAGLSDTSDRSASIDIEGVVYPGVTVTMYGVQYSFIAERSNCRIHLDYDRKIKVGPLS